MYLKTSHHLAKHQIPKSRLKCTLELIQPVQESPIDKEDPVSCPNHESISEFQSVLATIVRNNKIFDIKSLPGFLCP